MMVLKYAMQGSPGALLKARSIDTLLSPEEQAEVERLLSERLLQGFCLLERACPACTTPLVRLTPAETKTDHNLDNDSKPIDMAPSMVTSDTMTTLSSSSPMAPVAGVAFCVKCQAHVVSETAEVDLLERNDMAKRKGSILVLSSTTKIESRPTREVDTSDSSPPSSLDDDGSTVEQSYQREEFEIMLAGTDDLEESTVTTEPENNSVLESSLVTGSLATWTHQTESVVTSSRATQMRLAESGSMKPTEATVVTQTQENSMDGTDGTSAISSASVSKSNAFVHQRKTKIRRRQSRTSEPGQQEPSQSGQMQSLWEIQQAQVQKVVEAHQRKLQPIEGIVVSTNCPGLAAATNSIDSNVMSAKQRVILATPMKLPPSDMEVEEIEVIQCNEEISLLAASNTMDDNTIATYVVHNDAAIDAVKQHSLVDIHAQDDDLVIKSTLSHETLVELAIQRSASLITLPKKPALEIDFPMPESKIRREIAIKVLAAKMVTGFSIKEVQCESCSMPLLENGKSEPVVCFVCRAIRKRYFKEKAEKQKRQKTEQDKMQRETRTNDEMLRQRTRLNELVEKAVQQKSRDQQEESSSKSSLVQKAALRADAVDAKASIRLNDLAEKDDSREQCEGASANFLTVRKVALDPDAVHASTRVCVVGKDVAIPDASSSIKAMALGTGVLVVPASDSREQEIPDIGIDVHKLSGRDNREDIVPAHGIDVLEVPACASHEVIVANVATESWTIDHSLSATGSIIPPSAKQCEDFDAEAARLLSEAQEASSITFKAELLHCHIRSDANPNGDFLLKESQAKEDARSQVYDLKITKLSPQKIISVANDIDGESDLYTQVKGGDEGTMASLSSEIQRERWAILRAEARSAMTRRMMAGWVCLTERCRGAECNNFPLISKDGIKRCVVCGGHGSGNDAVYRYVFSNPLSEVEFAIADEFHVLSINADDEPVTLSKSRADIPKVPSSAIRTMSLEELRNSFENKRDKVSKEIGSRMQKGWTLLDMTCPQCAMPLMTDTTRSNEICVLCGPMDKSPNEIAPEQPTQSSTTTGTRSKLALKNDTLGRTKDQSVSTQVPEQTDSGSFSNLAVRKTTTKQQSKVKIIYAVTSPSKAKTDKAVGDGNRGETLDKSQPQTKLNSSTKRSVAASSHTATIAEKSARQGPKKEIRADCCAKKNSGSVTNEGSKPVKTGSKSSPSKLADSDITMAVNDASKVPRIAKSCQPTVQELENKFSTKIIKGSASAANYMQSLFDSVQSVAEKSSIVKTRSKSFDKSAKASRSSNDAAECVKSSVKKKGQQPVKTLTGRKKTQELILATQIHKPLTEKEGQEITPKVAGKQDAVLNELNWSRKNGSSEQDRTLQPNIKKESKKTDIMELQIVQPTKTVQSRKKTQESTSATLTPSPWILKEGQEITPELTGKHDAALSELNWSRKNERSGQGGTLQQPITKKEHEMTDMVATKGKDVTSLLEQLNESTKIFTPLLPWIIPNKDKATDLPKRCDPPAANDAEYDSYTIRRFPRIGPPEGGRSIRGRSPEPHGSRLLQVRSCSPVRDRSPECTVSLNVMPTESAHQENTEASIAAKMTPALLNETSSENSSLMRALMQNESQRWNQRSSMENSPHNHVDEKNSSRINDYMLSSVMRLEIPKIFNINENEVIHDSETSEYQRESLKIDTSIIRDGCGGRRNPSPGMSVANLPLMVSPSSYCASTNSGMRSVGSKSQWSRNGDRKRAPSPGLSTAPIPVTYSSASSVQFCSTSASSNSRKSSQHPRPRVTPETANRFRIHSSQMPSYVPEYPKGDQSRRAPDRIALYAQLSTTSAGSKPDADGHVPYMIGAADIEPSTHGAWQSNEGKNMRASVNLLHDSSETWWRDEEGRDDEIVIADKDYCGMDRRESSTRAGTNEDTVESDAALFDLMQRIEKTKAQLAQATNASEGQDRLRLLLENLARAADQMEQIEKS